MKDMFEYQLKCEIEDIEYMNNKNKINFQRGMIRHADVQELTLFKDATKTSIEFREKFKKEVKTAFDLISTSIKNKLSSWKNKNKDGKIVCTSCINDE